MKTLEQYKTELKSLSANLLADIFEIVEAKKEIHPDIEDAYGEAVNGIKITYFKYYEDDTEDGIEIVAIDEEFIYDEDGFSYNLDGVSVKHLIGIFEVLQEKFTN